MDAKYFKPELEELRIGSVVCTKNTSVVPESPFVVLRDWPDEYSDKYSAFVRHTLNHATYKIIFDKWGFWEDKIEIPYLTKEQIEAEGWKYETTRPNKGFNVPQDIFTKSYSDGCDDGYSFKWTIYIDNLAMFGAEPYGTLIIQEDKDGGFFGESTKHTAYWGDCKDINTFRYICKLLKIK